VIDNRGPELDDPLDLDDSNRGGGLRFALRGGATLNTGRGGRLVNTGRG
jgi:hypothetical protein